MNMHANVFVYKHIHAHMYIHKLLNFPFMNIKVNQVFISHCDILGDIQN